MGVGILTLPYVFHNTGIALGVVLLVICGLMNGYYYRIVVETMEYTQTFCYVELFNILYGKWVKRVMEILLILM